MTCERAGLDARAYPKAHPRVLQTEHEIIKTSANRDPNMRTAVSNSVCLTKASGGDASADGKSIVPIFTQLLHQRAIQNHHETLRKPKVHRVLCYMLERPLYIPPSSADCAYVRPSRKTDNAG
jgi:hypothetical protein